MQPLLEDAAAAAKAAGAVGSNVKTLDELLGAMEIGRFHYKLILVTGLAFMADAMEVSLLSFLSECAGEQWGLSGTQKAAITSSVFAGEMFGSFILGGLADRWGRKKLFLAACVLISVAGFASSFAPNFAFLLCARAVVGFGVGGLSVPFDLLAEFMPAEYRGKSLLFLEYFWTIGSIFVAGMAWAILDNMGDSGWRVLSLVCTVPVFASLVSTIYLPESPRWLLSQGRVQEAAEVMRKVGAENGDEFGDFILFDPFDEAADLQQAIDEPGRDLGPESTIYAPLSSMKRDSGEGRDATASDANVGEGADDHEASEERSALQTTTGSFAQSDYSCGGLFRHTDEMNPTDTAMVHASARSAAAEEPEAHCMELFHPEVRKTTFLLWLIWIGFGFGYYGIILFIGRIFSNNNDDDDGDDDGDDCSFAYLGIFISACSEALGITVAIMVIDIGRKKTQTYMYGLSAIATVFLGFGFANWALTIFAFVARFAVMGASSATWVATPELLPTRIRSTGHAVANSVGRVGAFFSPYLAESSTVGRFEVALALSVSLLLSSVAAALLPAETAGEALIDSKTQMRNRASSIEELNERRASRMSINN